VDDAGVVGVQVVEPLEDLPRPLLERLDGDVAVALPVLAQAPRRADLGDEVEHAGVAVEPHLVEPDDVAVVERAEEAHLGVEPVHHARVAVRQRAQPDAVPRHLDAFLLVEAAVHLLDGAQPQDVGVSPEPTRRVHLLERLLRALVPLLHRHTSSSSSWMAQRRRCGEGAGSGPWRRRWRGLYIA
jgi:hypothetical protein